MFRSKNKKAMGIKAVNLNNERFIIKKSNYYECKVKWFFNPSLKIFAKNEEVIQNIIFIYHTYI